MFSLQDSSNVLNFRFSCLFSMPNNKWLIKGERGGTLEKLFDSKGKILCKEIFIPQKEIWYCSIAAGLNCDLGNYSLTLEIKIVQS